MFDPREPYNDLPPVSSIYLELTPELDHLREEARVSIELLNYALKSLPNSEILLDTLALQEAKVSSNIENIRTTNDDLLRAVAFKDFNAETRAISNYKDALLEGFRLLGEKGQFGIEDLEAINAPVNTQGRGVRSNLSNFNTLTRIKRTNGNEDEIIYTPPHGKALLTEQLLDMLNYIYDDEQYDEHPLIKIALAHCQFENIHPFNDGNGRTGRILNILFLCQKGYLSEPILYASSYIIKNKNEYYEILRTSKEKEDYAEAVAYILRSFKETADRTRYIIEQIVKLTTEYTMTEQNDPDPPKQGRKRYFTDDMSGNRKALCDCIRLIMKKPFVRNCDLVDAGYTNRQTAAVYLDQLTDKGVLSKEKVGKENIYKNVKLLEMFDNDNEVLYE
jgi:Fic family protein